MGFVLTEGPSPYAVSMLPTRLRSLLALAASVALLAPAFLAHAGSDQEPSRPNVLLLLADDQRPDTIAAWGNEAIDTPNLDALVAGGFSFRGAHCLGSPHGAVCVPSRAMLATGRAYHGLDLKEFGGAPTLGQLLGESGYRTFGTGKWHNGREAFRRSFQDARAVYFGGMSDHNLVPIEDMRDGEFVDRRVGARHSSELFTDAAIEFLTGYRDEAPFFVYVAYTAPHDPRDPPLAYREHYYENRPPLPANFMPYHPFDNGAIIIRDENLAAWPRTRDVVSDQLAEYYGLITHIDDQVGRLVEVLERKGMLENTLVIYTADHGLSVGSHGLLGKQSLYEHSMGLPLILSGPGIPTGTSDALVYLHDLFPTLLGQAGVAAPEGIDSMDLSPVWKGESAALRDSLFTSYGKVQRSVRDLRWKLIRYPKVDVTQLFDLEADPDELVNLAAEPDQAERVARMRIELEAWQERLGDDLAWTADQVKPAEVNPSGTPRKPDRWQPAWIRAKYFDKGEADKR